jgi:RNA polymerase sigma-70 factor (ECF subfamily)
VLLSDGGGKRAAALNPIYGAENIIRLMEGLERKATGEFCLRPASINGAPGFVLAEPGGGVQTIAFDFADGKITAIYLVRNPDKLRGVVF